MCGCLPRKCNPVCALASCFLWEHSRHELIHEETPVAVHGVWDVHLDLPYSYQLVIYIVDCLCYSFLERQSSNNLRLI